MAKKKTKKNKMAEKKKSAAKKARKKPAAEKDAAKKPAKKAKKMKIKSAKAPAKKTKVFSLAKIKVVGIGGAGGNAITRMYDEFPRGVDLIALNTDIQDLEHCQAKKKICIGKNVTRGLGTGMNPDLGRQAAEESREEITEAVKDADLIFITAGLGGGTGTGVSPVVAEIAKELGILTVAIVTKPFSFEGGQRGRIAEDGLFRLRDRVDTIITISNDKIFSVIGKETSLIKAFEEIDQILKDSVSGIAELILNPGIINVDFADIKAITRDAGSALIGIGVSSGKDRAVKAVSKAVSSPLLEMSIDGAKGLLFSISGQRDLKMNEVNDIAKAVSENIDQSAKVIFGTYHDRRLKKGDVKVTLIATGFSNILVKDRFSPFSAGRDFVMQNNHLPFEENKAETEEIPGMKTGAKSDANSGGKNDKREKTAPAARDAGKEEVEEKEKIKEREIDFDIPAFLRKKKK